MIKELNETQKIAQYFAPVQGAINLYYGHVGNGKTYNATADILDLLKMGDVVYANWKIDFKDFDERNSFWIILVKTIFFQKRFFKYPKENLHYFNPDDVDIEFLGKLANCHVFIDEGQWILDSYEGTKFNKTKRKVILHTRHYNRTLNIITQRPTSIHVSARGNVERYYKCEKKLSWPFLIFRRTEFQDMTNETVDETLPLSTKTYFAKKEIMNAYKTLAMRSEDAIVQRVNFESCEYNLWDKIKLAFNKLTKKNT